MATDNWDVVQNPHLSEKSMDIVDRENKIVLIVNEDSTKPEIKNAVEELFDVEVEKVNTLLQGSQKKAYVKLTEDYDAMDVATRLGMI